MAKQGNRDRPNPLNCQGTKPVTVIGRRSSDSIRASSSNTAASTGRIDDCKPTLPNASKTHAINGASIDDVYENIHNFHQHLLPMNTATKNTRQILYVSDARYGLTQEDIEQILSTSRRKNPDKEVSGILIYVDGVFVQVLEGPTIEIDGLYGTIANDSRHENVEILSDRFVQERTFSNWAMAYLETTAAGLAEHAGIPGMLDRSHLLKMLSSDDGRLRAFLHNLARLPS